MAYGLTTSIAVDNATPKVGQVVNFVLTLNNSGTVDVTWMQVESFVTTVLGASIWNLENPMHVANGTTKYISFRGVMNAAGAVAVNCQVRGVRDDTSAVIETHGSSAVTVTAS